MPNLDKHALYEFDILRHVERTSTLNNRLAAQKLGVSIKLAHQILKRMVQRGFLHVNVVHARRWDYFLTPKGIAEKARLTVEFFDFSLQFYREARRRSARVCRDLAAAGRRRVAFLGAGDLAEIVYLGVREWDLRLTAVYAAGRKRQFMGLSILPLSALSADESQAVIVCLYEAGMPMRGCYLPPGVPRLETMEWVFGQDDSI